MYLAIDIGGTKTLIASFNSDGKLENQLKFSTPQDYSEFIKELAARFSELGKDSFNACAIGIPGLLNREKGIVKALGNLPWVDKPIGADIQSVVGCPVLIENDTKLAGLSEAIAILSKYKNVVYITVSTGIGTAFISGGEIVKQTRDSEAGHMTLEHEGKFKRWETFASGKAAVDKYGRKVSDINEPEILKEIAHNLAVGLIAIVAILTPDALVIGGGVGAHLDKYKAYLDEEMAGYTHPVLKIPPVLQAQRAEEAVIYGCYELARSHARRQNAESSS